MKILLALDASPDSNDAAHLITHVAPPPQLFLLHVVDIGALRHSYLTSDDTKGNFEAYRQEVSRLSEDVLHKMRDELTSHAQEIRLIADSGDPAESIIQTAEEVQAELIILGHRGMTGTSMFLLGGVSQKVATYAPCSVLVCKGFVPTIDRILLAVDGSDTSDKAAEFLAACPFKSPIHVYITTIWAPPPPPSALVSASEMTAPSAESSVAKTKGEEALDKVADKFQQSAYEAEVQWRYGDPPLAILELARQDDVQLIVVGARGLKGIKRFLLGSVSQKILMHATCSVLIVR
jgi:nucleotide-binding universal stress UspA family protein